MMLSSMSSAFGFNQIPLLGIPDWKCSLLSHENTPIFVLICPKCGGSDFTCERQLVGDNLWTIMCKKCGWHVSAKRVGDAGPISTVIEKDDQNKGNQP